MQEYTCTYISLFTFLNSLAKPINSFNLSSSTSYSNEYKMSISFSKGNNVNIFVFQINSIVWMCTVIIYKLRQLEAFSTIFPHKLSSNFKYPMYSFLTSYQLNSKNYSNTNRFTGSIISIRGHFFFVSLLYFSRFPWYLSIKCFFLAIYYPFWMNVLGFKVWLKVKTCEFV